MQSQAETTWLLSLSPPERTRFLVLLAHGITIAVRAVSRGSATETIESIGHLNEAQHQVTGYLSACAKGNEDISFLPRVVSSVLNLQNLHALQQSRQAWSYACSEFNGHAD